MSEPRQRPLDALAAEVGAFCGRLERKAADSESTVLDMLGEIQNALTALSARVTALEEASRAPGAD